jgi:dTDP-4-amino-4,6-dideoxyglucose
VFFDAAHAFGCSHDGRPIGHFGEAEVFSLHATKVMHSLEGGLITTRNAALADTLRLLRNYGFTAEDWSDTLGLNAKMSEFSAAVGLSNLEGLPELLAHNQHILANYRHGLANAPGLSLLDAPPGERFNHHYAVLQLTADCALPRDTLRHLLRAEGVYARRYFRPGCHHFPPYQTPGLHLPVTDQLSGTLLQLPTGWQVTPDTALRIGEFLSWCLAHAGEIEQRLSSQNPD